ncbi:MAG: heme exporter protein CcmB [Sulfurimicrobium sp.]|jgi:heme exporter protein B|nr:heme exporter protein CcmB [Sulfurimicrobium sp.]MDP2197926.1 heme exporter protein CcmB [Sulfurimicrobium sp.]MDP2962981.1 heme exporter protein CcmB [Sulfurimicrobium sp.]MDZ7654845.1 heme exporter protein CcmB [Sulfurimicrobium sp.]
MLQTVFDLLRRELTLAMRRRGDVLTVLFFFVIVASLFPLGVGPDTKLLRLMGGGVVWVSALLAAMLSLGRLFANDYADGTLEQLVLTPTPPVVWITGKILAHWLVSGVPLILVAPVLGIQFGLSNEALGVLIFSLLLGTPVLSLIGAVGAALTLGLRGGGVLVSLLVLPLYIPVLIFGAGAVDGAMSGLGAEAHLSLLGSILILAFLLTPWAVSAALRISIE